MKRVALFTYFINWISKATELYSSLTLGCVQNIITEQTAYYCGISLILPAYHSTVSVYLSLLNHTVSVILLYLSVSHNCIILLYLFLITVLHYYIYFSLFES